MDKLGEVAWLAIDRIDDLFLLQQKKQQAAEKSTVIYGSHI
jgi:hypothetical protein